MDDQGVQGQHGAAQLEDLGVLPMMDDPGVPGQHGAAKFIVTTFARRNEPRMSAVLEMQTSTGEWPGILQKKVVKITFENVYICDRNEDKSFTSVPRFIKMSDIQVVHARVEPLNGIVLAFCNPFAIPLT